uniref:Uncharacterized protein LOC102808711 n=1 Tax=Saccoglossus kowalevskii TaxID=10224 RepID=A0ABM0M7K2_SACKO|nr:PREDICTED: uncharacterized protein LOC102808711 [Saccoglossus kowalevskii]
MLSYMLIVCCVVTSHAEKTHRERRDVNTDLLDTCASITENTGNPCVNNPCHPPAVCLTSCTELGYICLCRTDVFTGADCDVVNVKIAQDGSECYYEDDGSDYRGSLNVTKNGRTCQNWLKQYPHTHTITRKNYPSFGLGDHNSCRNPDNGLGIWCYTTDPGVRYEYCDGIQPMEYCEYEQPPNVSYVGCYRQYEHENWVEISRRTFTPGKCVRHCAKYGLLFASVRVDDEVKCYCDNMYDRTRPMDKSNCSTPCPVNKNYFCGGTDSVSVYYTGIPYPKLDTCGFGDEIGLLLNSQKCLWFSMEAKTWMESEQDCVLRGGHLTRVQDKVTLEAIVYHIFEAYRGLETYSYWIGANDLEHEDQFIYNDIDETVVDTETDLFYSGEPNNLGTNGQQCLILLNDFGFRIDDMWCDMSHRYICTPNDIIVSSDDGCGVGGNGALRNGTCFHLIKEVHNWDYANLACARVGGRLATIKDRATQLFIRHQALLSGSNGSWWFGLHYDSEMNGMVYTDQSPVQNEAMFTSQIPQSGDCTVLDYEYNYFWKQTSCADNNFFICQEGWEMAEDNKCYLYLGYSFSGNYSDSLQHCEMAGALLVNINTEPINQFVVDLIQNSCIGCSGYSWIGNLVDDPNVQFENWAVDNITLSEKCSSIDITEGRMMEVLKISPHKEDDMKYGIIAQNESSLEKNLYLDAKKQAKKHANETTYMLVVFK